MNAPKIIFHKETAIPHGTEHETEMEVSGRQGETIRIKQFMRKVDMGDAYTVLVHMTKGSDSAHTILTTGVKGEISGEHRRDQVEIVMLGADGTVLKMPPKEINVLLSNPFAGMTFEETFLKLGQEHP